MTQDPHQEPIEPPPAYSRLSSPRPPPIDDIPELASGLPNRICAWNFSGLPEQGSESASATLDGALLPDNPDAFAHEGIFDQHDVVEHLDVIDYLNNPFTRRPEPGKEAVVISHSGLLWLHCHHKVLPSFWKCTACPPNNCFDRWDIQAMEDQHPDYGPSCPRSNCQALASRQSVLVNTQKESIMTVAGENLMASRLEEPLMWCCKCAGFRGHGGGHNLDCAHCLDFEESSCRDCVRCNKFLEPTNFGDGETVQFGVTRLHARASAIVAGTEPAVARRAMVMLKTAYGLDDPVRAWWAVTCSSLILGHSMCKPTVPEITRPLARPTMASTPLTSIYPPESAESVRPFLAYRQPEDIQAPPSRFSAQPWIDSRPQPVRSSH